MNKQRKELASEAEHIMLAGGFSKAQAEHFGKFWRVRGELPDKNEHSGTTFHQPDPQDPRALARALVSLVKADPVEDIPEAPETVEPTFAPGEDHFDVPVEAEQTPAHEGDGETGAEVGASDQSAAGVIDTETVGDDRPDLGAEILEEHPQEYAPSQFVFGDNLDQKRTAAIGLVMQAALARMPAWSDQDTARLSELRNFAMGVAEGRWNDDPGSRGWLEELEARLRARNEIVTRRDALVEFLNGASRDELEAFDPEAGWP